AVNVTVVAPRGKIAGALLETVTEPLTVSFAVGFGTTSDVPDGPVCSTVIGGGTPLNVGGVVSTTVTVVVAIALLPAASRAVNVTIVAPRGKIAGALFDTATEPLTVSLAIGIATAMAVPDGLACSTGNGPEGVGPITAPVEESVGANRIGGGRLSIVHAYVNVSPSGSLEPVPFSVTIA